jgi:phosphoglycerate dehydrogenase-like enzyme
LPDPISVVVHAACPGPLAETVRARHPDVQVTTCDSYACLPAVLEADRPHVVFTIRFAGTRSFPASALVGAGGPRWIAVGGSGVDHLGQWDDARTTVTNSAGVAADMMAEYVMAAALYFRLDVPGLETDKSLRHWRRDRVLRPLRGGTALIVGLGRTGHAVAARARAFGMCIIGVRATPRPTPGVDEIHPPEHLPALWGSADLVAICVPLVPGTRGLVSAAAIAAMKKDAILVDVSRGGVSDCCALASALRAGRLAGAALDVFETEPLPIDHPLWQAPRMMISPHCSSVFRGWEQATIAMFCDNLRRWKDGEPLENVVDPRRGY